MQCPACKQSMVVMEYKEVEIDFCTACGGCWLDQGELGLILHGVLHLPKAWELAVGRSGKRPCPHCRRKMFQGPLPGTGIEVDVCATHGLWLDRGELQDVIRSQGDAPELRALAGFFDDLFGSSKKR
ncbi:MAG: zf-TFIIB domain-containing protein [Lentisphaerota bacterium]